MKRALTARIATFLFIGLLTSAEAQETVLRFEGRVIWISGQSMALALDNGPAFGVDLTRISQSDLRNIAQNDYVVVTGVVLRPRSQFVAISIRRISAWFPQSP
jgi:hypothetical protein